MRALARRVAASAPRKRCRRACVGPTRPHAAQVHFPFPAYGNKLLAEALGQAVDEGLCRAVGVCNFGADGMQELHGLLAQRGVVLATNQARVGPACGR
jgi:diketogulonate reductase-like aldo/keto reductase